MSLDCLVENIPEDAPQLVRQQALERRLRRRIAWIILFALAASALLWSSILAVIRTERENEIASIYLRNANLAYAVEEHARRTFRDVDQFALAARNLQKRSAGDAEWKQLFAWIGSGDYAGMRIIVTDRYGNIIRSNVPFTGISVADRAYYQVQLEGKSDALHVGAPIRDHLSGNWSIPISRGLNSADGAFDGIVVVAVDSDYFSRYFRKLDLGPGGAVALVGRDGTVRAIQSGEKRGPYNSADESTLGAALIGLANGHDNGSFFSPFRIGATPRYVSFRALRDFPLVLFVGRAVDDTLAGVEARATRYRLGAAAATLLLLLFCATLSRSFVNDHRAMRRRAKMRAEQANTQQALNASQARYRQLIEDLPEAIVMTQGGVVQFVNDEAVQLFGATTSADLNGRATADFVDPSGQFEAERKTELLNRAPMRLQQWDLRLRKLDGSPFDAEFSSTSFSVGGKMLVQHLIRNVTVRKQTELAVLQAKAGLEARVAERTAQLEAVNQELEAFSYSVSHDLRAPLRAVNGFARILAGHLGERLDEEGRRLLERIEAGGKRMGALIDSLLEFARSGRGELRTDSVDLDAIAAEVVSQSRAAYRHAEVSLGVLGAVKGDAGLLREVFENLIDNALKYSSKIAQPRVELGRLSTPVGEEFFVRDNGAGFDPDFAGNLFKPFHRLHSESEFPGTGVGLALCRRIIERHGGQIRAESSADQGTTFYFTLPANGPTIDPTTGSSAPSLSAPA